MLLHQNLEIFSVSKDCSISINSKRIYHLAFASGDIFATKPGTLDRSGMNEMNKFLSMSMMRAEMEDCKDLIPTKTCKKLKKKGKCDSEAAEVSCKKTCDHCDDEEVQEGKFLGIIQLHSFLSLWGLVFHTFISSSALI